MSMKRMMVIVAVVSMGASAAIGAMERPVPPAVFVQDVKFRQRYPWNGLVDIDANFICSDPATNLAVYVAAWDNVKDRALTVKTVWVDGDETKNPDLVVKSGTRRIVWDARADNPDEIYDNVSISVQAYVRDMRYLVVDLSGGTNATEFAYSFMPDPPEGGWTDEYKTTKLGLRFIPAGTFLMGSPVGEVGHYYDETQHKVTLTQPFYMAVFELTDTQYSLVRGGTSTTMTPFLGARSSMRGDHVPYNWLTMPEVSPTSIAGVLRAKTGISTFDLPTEARWEYACRAGTTTGLNDGSNLLTKDVDWDINMSKLGSYNGNGIVSVGRYKPNAWGLYDMHGNAAEWCLDGADLDSLYAYPSVSVVDPIGNEPYRYRVNASTSRYHFIVRGAGSINVSSSGTWYTYLNSSVAAWRCRSAYRGLSRDGDYAVGFRICCDANLLK